MGGKVDLRGRLWEVTVGVCKKLSLVKGLTKGSVLDAELVNEGTAFLPTPVCFICGCEGRIQELGTGFEGLHMTVGLWYKDRQACIRGSETHASLRSRKARCALRFCSARLLWASALPPFWVSPSFSEGDPGV